MATEIKCPEVKNLPDKKGVFKMVYYTRGFSESTFPHFWPFISGLETSTPLPPERPVCASKYRSLILYHVDAATTRGYSTLRR